jgi:single-stranded-DNA-specific exonuclease
MDIIGARQFHSFLAESGSLRQVVVHDTDADGLTAGVLLEAALRRLGHPHVQRFLPDRSRNLWCPEIRERLRRLSPERLYVLDLGVRADPVLDGVSTCYIDHHAPEGQPADSVVVSSYRESRQLNTSALVWELCHPIVDLADRDWIAAVGVIGDLQERDAAPLISAVRRKYGLRAIREVVALINAGRRVSPALAWLAADLLAQFDTPGSLLDAADAEPLREARTAFQRALAGAKRAAPVFSDRVALLRVRSPYQVHPVIAQIWRSRLPTYIVIAANEEYLPGLVNFSVRGPAGTNVREFLRRIVLPPGEGEYGMGHDAASGGSLPIARWNQLLAALGFPAATFAAPARDAA